MKQKKEGLVNNKVTIIGLGEIGSDTLKETNKKRKDVFGVDINPKILSKLSIFPLYLLWFALRLIERKFNVGGLLVVHAVKR